jgi:uncharacterized membrane protein
VSQQSTLPIKRTGPFPLPAPALLPIVSLGLVALFLAYPAAFDDKARAALHGLCAQRPSHTLAFGDRLLPFDARMTGIYGGFAVTTVYLLLRGRIRAFGLPTWPALAALAGGLASLALDGTNSLLLDLGLRHLYQPRNELRLATGLATGLALATVVCFLLATTLWRSGHANRRVVSGVGEVAGLAALQVPPALLLLVRPTWLYLPIALGLVLSAVAVVSSLALVVLTILRRRENSYLRAGQLDRVGVLALLVGVAVMAVIAGGRFWLESATGVQSLP